MVIGRKMPGSDMLARIAIGRLPWSRITASPVLRSVAMARKGMDRSSKSPVTLLPPVAVSNSAIRRSPCDMPPEIWTRLPCPPRPIPIGASCS